jgi:dTDP-4-dehydrorhamnose 3,5-epimerase
MTFTETALAGAWLIDIARIDDERGFFARTFLPEEFTSRGLDPTLAQCNIAFNRRRGTIRGLHFQRAPFDETKIIRCTRGAVCDVILDLRANSPTFRRWLAVELTSDNHRMLYVPRGMAHGYQTLTDDAETYYHVSAPYSAPHAAGVRWNDPAFAIDWPLGEPTVISGRDRAWPDFDGRIWSSERDLDIR